MYSSLATALPLDRLKFKQNTQVKMRLYPVERGSNLALQYVDLTGNTIRVGVCGGTGKPTGTASDPTPQTIALATNFNAIANGFETATNLDFNNTDVATFLGSLAAKESTFEIEATDPSGYRTKYVQEGCDVLAAVIESTPSGPSPGQTYYTKEEADGLFKRGFVKILAADETYTTTTLADSAGLTGALVNDELYEFEGEFIFTCAGDPGGIKYSVSGPTTPVFVRFTDEFNDPTEKTAYDQTFETQSDGVNTWRIRLSGSIKTAASGNLKPRFAQLLSNATPVTIKKGSWFRAGRKLG